MNDIIKKPKVWDEAAWQDYLAGWLGVNKEDIRVNFYYEFKTVDGSHLKTLAYMFSGQLILTLIDKPNVALVEHCREKWGL